MGKAVLYVRVGTEEQLVNDHAEKQAVADGLKLKARKAEMKRSVKKEYAISCKE